MGEVLSISLLQCFPQTASSLPICTTLSQLIQKLGTKILRPTFYIRGKSHQCLLLILLCNGKGKQVSFIIQFSISLLRVRHCVNNVYFCGNWDNQVSLFFLSIELLYLVFPILNGDEYTISTKPPSGFFIFGQNYDIESYCICPKN